MRLLNGSSRYSAIATVAIANVSVSVNVPAVSGCHVYTSQADWERSKRSVQ